MIQEHRWLFWSTGGAALLTLAGCGLVAALRVAIPWVLAWLDSHVESLVALALVALFVCCLTYALLQLQPQPRLDRWPRVVGGSSPEERRRMARLRNGGGV